MNSLTLAAQAEYRAIFAAAMDGLAVVDTNGHITDCNEAFCQMVGCRREELLGAHIRQLEAKETPEEITRHLSAIIDRGHDRFETRFWRKDGVPVDVEVSVSVLPGDRKAMVAFAREIGTRKRVEARLVESEARYRRLAESSPDPILMVDCELRFDYVNAAAASLWGRSPEAMTGLSLHELFAAEAAGHHYEMARRVFSRGEMLRYDERIQTPNGQRWMEIRLVPIVGADGRVRSLILFAIDVSERKRSELLLQAERDLARSLSLTSDLPTALKTLLNVGLQIEGVDCGGVYLRDEATGALTLATHCGLFSAKFIKQVSHYQGSSDRAEIVSKGLAVYGLYRQLPSHADDADEHEGLRAVAVVPLCHEGTVIGCLNLGSHTVDSLPNDTRAVVEAIAAQAAGAIARTRAETERRRLEAQLLEIADREQARIGQEIHDGLCQQLVSLAFDANALVNELNKSRRSEAKIASRLAHHLDQAITEARRLARGLFPIRLETEGLVSAVEELARTTRERFEIQCDFTCVPPLPSQAPAEATHLFKIAQEAVNNAVKHGRARRILIQLKSTDDHLELQVEDDGVGLRAEPADKMAGMGRHIMDYRARSLGGQIRVTPREPGGTRVSCCVPRHRASSGGA